MERYFYARNFIKKPQYAILGMVGKKCDREKLRALMKV
jgi:hypothetical protein